MASIIQGGCGNPFHFLRFIPVDFPFSSEAYACDNCVRLVLTNHGIYYCSDCGHKTCTSCASQLSLYYPTLNTNDVAQIAEQLRNESLPQQRRGSLEEQETNVAVPTIPCTGSSSHTLKLLSQSPYDVFDKHFICNVCWQEGDAELYHCDTCQFDTHRDCAEVKETVEVFFHEHPLDLLIRNCYKDVPSAKCDFCERSVQDSEWVYTCQHCDFDVHVLCAKHAKKLMHVVHPHILTLVEPSPNKACDGCMKPVKGYRYTCPPCDFDLHPLCAAIPTNPLCIFDSSHRLSVEFQRRQFQCGSCHSPGHSWLYSCEHCKADIHLDCVNDMDEEVEDDEEEQDNEEEFYNKLYAAAMLEYVNKDYAAKVDMLSELLDAFIRSETDIGTVDQNNNQAASPTSSSSRESPVTTKVQARINTPAQSETHVLDARFANLHVHENRQAENKSTEEEAQRKATKRAAKEAKEKEKAKSKAEQDAKIENLTKLVQDLHSSLGKTSNSMSKVDAQVLARKLDTIDEKIVKIHDKTEKIHNTTENIRNVSHEIKATQKHLKQRRVPRIVLCSERQANMKQKLLTSLRVGIRAVQLHLLCEEPGQEHLVLDAPGCEINQKIGERWEKLKPLLATGLQLVTMAVNAGGHIAGLGTIFPNLGKHVWDIQATDLGEHGVRSRKVHGEQEVAEALKRAQAEEFAAQWLVSYLEENGISISDAFGLFRVRYQKSNPPRYTQGTLAWLCTHHQSLGLKTGTLESFPVRR